MKKYGILYQGSKSRLAERIVALLPEADNLYDIFAGGCAISHCALLSGKWKRVFINDITDSVKLFEDALNGNIPDGSEWISREEFERRKDDDPWVRILWSFSNNQKDYLYSAEIEPYKKAVHEMIYAPTPNERRLKFRQVCKLTPQILDNQKNGGIRKTIDQEQMERQRTMLQIGVARTFQNGYIAYNQRSFSSPIPRQCYDMQSGEAQQRLNAIAPFCQGVYQTSVGDYRDVEMLPNSIIYCDPPYKNTAEYRYDKFDHEAFYEWALKQTCPIFISEYEMPSEFVAIAEWSRISTFSSTNNSLKRIEKIFIPITQINQ